MQLRIRADMMEKQGEAQVELRKVHQGRSSVNKQGQGRSGEGIPCPLGADG